MLVDVAASVGDVQTRNVATIGGSLAADDAANDIVAALLTLDAQVHVTGVGGPCVVGAADLARALAGSADLIVSIEFAATSTTAGSAYAKFKNMSNNYPICGLAAVVQFVDNGTIERVNLAVTGATRHAQRLASETTITGVAPGDVAGLCSRLIGEDLAVTDAVASADYREHLVDVLAADAILPALARI